MFCAEYLKDLSPGAAYARAYGGRTTNHASRQAKALLDREDIRAEIEALKDRPWLRSLVQADRLLEEAASIAFISAADIIDKNTGAVKPPNDIPEHAWRAISQVEVTTLPSGRTLTKYRFWNKVEMIKLLGQHLNIWGPDQVTQNVNVQVGMPNVNHAQLFARLHTLLNTIGAERMASESVTGREDGNSPPLLGCPASQVLSSPRPANSSLQQPGG